MVTHGAGPVLHPHRRCRSSPSVAAQVPNEWQPNAPYQDTEVSNTLRGVLPQESTLMITPEYWYYVKS